MVVRYAVAMEEVVVVGQRMLRAEDQRLDDDGDRLHVAQLSADVDVVEIGELQLVDRDDVVACQYLIGQHAADDAADVAVEGQDDRPRDVGAQSRDDPVDQSAQQSIGGLVVPV